MPKNPPEGMPRLTPYLFYNDLDRATDWLIQHFGLVLRFSLPNPDQGMDHAELAYQDAIIMMGRANTRPGTKSPVDLGGVNQSLYLYVDDLAAHYQHSLSAGADILYPPEEMFWGDRVYSCKDLEGHVWSFAQHVKDIAPEELQPDFT